jgi:prepilin-type N-terminal cleavage/methylation domain-containing protein
MKKAFSLMEVIISVVILSVVMITLLKIKSNNIYLVSKSEQKSKSNDYILMAIDFSDKPESKNENISLEKYKYENEDLRKELKDIKVSIKDEKIETKTIYNGSNNINVTTYSRTFSLENSDIKKKLYSFKIEL